MEGGALVRLNWLRERFSGDTNVDSSDRTSCVARVYLLYLHGCTFLRDKSNTRVSINYLALLHDIQNIHIFVSGAGALAYLYRQLDFASQAHVAWLSGYLTLFQA